MAGTAAYLDDLERDEECRVLCGNHGVRHTKDAGGSFRQGGSTEDIQRVCRVSSEDVFFPYPPDRLGLLGYAMPTVLLQLLLDGRGYDSFSGEM